MTDLTSFLILGLAVFFTAQLVRAFPWPQWLAQRKPLTCNACMSGWSAIGFAAAGWRAIAEEPRAVVPFIGAAGVSYLLMLLKDRSTGSTWPPPPLDGSSNS